MFSSAEAEMASTPVGTPESVQKQSNGLHLVAWVNDLLKINFKDAQQFGSGSSSPLFEIILSQNAPNTDVLTV